MVTEYRKEKKENPLGSRFMIKQKEEILKNWNMIIPLDRDKELSCLIDEIQKVMLERIKIFKDLKSSKTAELL